MEKGHEIVNDTKLDIKNSGGNATADFGIDLAKDDGIDLNADFGADSMSKTLERSTGQRIAAGFFTLPAIVGGGTSEAPNEHVRGIMNEPVAAHHQVYERPESVSVFAQSLEHFEQTGEVLPIQIGGKDYDDGRFRPDAQIEALEIGTALNQPIAADRTDPPSNTNVGDLSEVPMGIENLEIDEQPETEMSEDDDLNKEYMLSGDL
ncbi:MAG: hypothetical protein FWG63_09075 [Defluviitaleaceae bacterium]|nr:hypothetical protein [Defluviitaleaceae bacterium]